MNNNNNKHTYDTATLLCPQCQTYLLDFNSHMKSYKKCGGCGYTREITTAKVGVIASNVGDGISPIIGQTQLLRPEERNGES